VSERTPLDETHRGLGATMVDFAGWSMPLRYSSETSEHLAVRSRAGLFDLSHMGEIELSGAGAGAALDHAVVGHISVLAPGRAKYTMICAEDGGILDDLIVYVLDPARYLVVANAANAATVLAALRERAGGFDAEVTDRRSGWALLAVQGPAAEGILAPLTAVDLGPVKYYTVTPAAVAGVDVLLARTGYTGEDGFELFCAPADATRLWESLRATGEAAGLVPAGLAARDTLRLEAGMPLYGHELSASLTPADAGLGRVVSFEKAADFVGRAALEARALAGAEPARRLVGLVAGGRRVPRAGYRVLEAAGGEVVGEVTSGAPSPTLGRPIAMAYLDAGCAEPGTEVAFEVRGRAEPAEVVALPFYRRPR
jgi:aminomethyltransferase